MLALARKKLHWQSRINQSDIVSDVSSYDSKLGLFVAVRPITVSAYNA